MKLIKKDGFTMSDKSILQNIKAKRFYLNKIVANRIKKDPAAKRYNITQEVDCEILQNTKDNLSIKVTTETFVDPDELFHIILEHIADFKLNKEISDEEVDENINELISALGEEVSYIIASITKKMIGAHIILPPGLKLTKQNE